MTDQQESAEFSTDNPLLDQWEIVKDRWRVASEMFADVEKGETAFGGITRSYLEDLIHEAKVFKVMTEQAEGLTPEQIHQLHEVRKTLAVGSVVPDA